MPIETAKISDLYDLIYPNAHDALTVLSSFVIDPNKNVRLIIKYPASTGATSTKFCE